MDKIFVLGRSSIRKYFYICKYMLSVFSHCVVHDDKKQASNFHKYCFLYHRYTLIIVNSYDNKSRLQICQFSQTKTGL